MTQYGGSTARVLARRRPPDRAEPGRPRSGRRPSGVQRQILSRRRGAGAGDGERHSFRTHSAGASAQRRRALTARPPRWSQQPRCVSAHGPILGTYLRTPNLTLVQSRSSRTVEERHASRREHSTRSVFRLHRPRGLPVQSRGRWQRRTPRRHREQSHLQCGRAPLLLRRRLHARIATAPRGAVAGGAGAAPQASR